MSATTTSVRVPAILAHPGPSPQAQLPPARAGQEVDVVAIRGVRRAGALTAWVHRVPFWFEGGKVGCSRVACLRACVAVEINNSVIRRAVASDAAAVADVWLRAFAAALPGVRRAHTDDQVRSWLREVVVPGQETWVATVGGSVVGMMVLDGDDLDQLYLDPAWQGQGIGGRLVDLAKRRRPAGLALWTFQVERVGTPLLRAARLHRCRVHRWAPRRGMRAGRPVRMAPWGTRALRCSRRPGESSSTPADALLALRVRARSRRTAAGT
ncbi:hypothetical protein SALBM135S_10162 [Streptomyces alboniger]